MEETIKTKFVYLTEHINNLNSIMNHLFQNDIISTNEREEILLPHKTKLIQTTEALILLRRKDWDLIGTIFINILRITGNNNCADVILGLKPHTIDNEIKILENKFWPVEKPLVNSFQERKSQDNKLLVETLYDELTKSSSGITVISQKVTVSGFGGVGKTTLAKWYAKYYENEYDYIFWLDCGEGSLYNSFTKLSNDLHVENSSTLDLYEKATSCFEILSKFKCLLIYDNAESFFGNDGIKDLLPKKTRKNFHTIITSRNREWGNETGFGKIDEFHLDVFEEEDCILFFERNLQIKFERYQLVELSYLLGYLPLALQIAVATLNRTKMLISGYIERILNTDVILKSLVKLDDYEKTIYTTMSISLEIIQKNEDFGHLATNILLTLGYLRPDNNEAELFAEIENVPVEEIQNAADVLEQHSLIGKTVKIFGSISVYILNVHRLLQQVVRSNCKVKSTEKNVLGNILQISTYDLMHYKLIPYMYANKLDGLRDQFKDVKTQLKEKIRLHQLVDERRYYEATNLSKIVYESTLIERKPTVWSRAVQILRLKQSKVSKTARKNEQYASTYNYAICLYLEKRLSESLPLFESLQAKLLPPYSFKYDSLGITEWGEVPSEYAVDLWCVHLKFLMGKTDEAKKLVHKLENIKKTHVSVSTYYKLNLALDLSIFGISTTEELSVSRSNLLYRNDEEYNTYFRQLLFKSISFREITFVDSSFIIIERIDLHQLPFRSQDIRIGDCKTEIHVNMSFLPEFVTKVNFQNVYLHSEGHLLCNLVSVTMLSLANKIDIHKWLKCCHHLIKLSLAQIDLDSPLRLSSLPQSLKVLYLQEILICEESKSELILEKFNLNYYSLDQIIKIIPLIKCETLSLSQFAGKYQEPVHSHRCGLVPEAVEMLTNIINSTDVIALQDSRLKDTDGLQQYGIKVKNHYSFLISRQKGRKLNQNERGIYFYF